MPSAPSPRRATNKDIIPVARLWHDAWHETQRPFVPDALIRLRTFESFKFRLQNMGDRLRVIGPVGAPIGMCSIKKDELDQLFVAPGGRGTGAASALLMDAERRLAAQGTTTAVLDCLIENEPAKRFYSRHGWVNSGIEIAQLDTSDGPFDLKCIIFRKQIAPRTS